MPTGFKQLGAEFQVSTHTTNSQAYSTVASLSGGGFVVTWRSRLQDGSSASVYAQQYDASGIAVGSEFKVNTYATGAQDFASVTGLASGGFVVTWQSDTQDGSGDGIFAQMYDATGGAVGSEFQVNTFATGDQQYSSVTGLDGGGFVVTWQSDGSGGSDEGVYGQIYNTAGGLVGAQFQVSNSPESFQVPASVTALSDGGFVVTWDSDYLDGDGSFSVYAQRYTAAGAVHGVAFQINTHTPDDQKFPVIAALEDGGFVVAWNSNNQDGALQGVFAQRYDATSTPVGAEFQVNTVFLGHQHDPSITGLADGGFVVTWYSSTQPGDDTSGVYGQRYDAAGDAIGGEFNINTYKTSYQAEASVAGLEDGGFVVSWQSNGQDGDEYGIYAQQFAARLFGTSGAETMVDLVGAGWMHGQDGNDILKGMNGHDVMNGGAGDDKLFGGKGNDKLVGVTGKDKLFGGKGADTLSGGKDRDRLSGGEGHDKFVFKLGFGKDKITDFEDDIDTYQLDEDLWGGGMTKQQVINTYASVDGSDIVFDFGSDELRLQGFTDLSELKDDMAII